MGTLERIRHLLLFAAMLLLQALAPMVLLIWSQPHLDVAYRVFPMVTVWTALIPSRDQATPLAAHGHQGLPRSQKLWQTVRSVHNNVDLIYIASGLYSKVIINLA